MAEIKSVFGASHTPLLATRSTDVSKDTQERVFQVYERMGQTFLDRNVEVLVIFGNDHIQVFPPDQFPALAIQAAPVFHNVASEGRMPDVKGGRKGNMELGFHLTEHLMDEGFDPLLCHTPTIDHTVTTPIHRMGEPGIPLVPVLQNTVLPPLAPPNQSIALGRSVRRALEAYDKVERVGVLATGGMSHWIGTPEMGKIDSDWDRAALNLLEEGKVDVLANWSQKQIDSGGNGANEIRNWISAAALAGNTRGETWLYEPVPIWLTGVAVMEWPVGPPLPLPNSNPR